MFQYIGSKKEYRRPGVDKVNELKNRLGLLHHVLKHIGFGNLHLVPLALNLFVQDADILIMVQQLRLMTFS